MSIYVGKNVRLHPAMDLWMRGVTRATVIQIGPKWITLDWAGRRGRALRLCNTYATMQLLAEMEG